MAEEDKGLEAKKELENIRTKIDELEDLQLTNNLKIIELKKELNKLKERGIDKGKGNLTQEARKTIARIKEEEKKLEKLKEQFEDPSKKFSEFEKDIRKLKRHLDRLEKKPTKSVEPEEKEEPKEENLKICDSCGMKNDPDAKYCVVCGKELE